MVQTAFIGDVILTLPLVQVLRERLPDAHIAFAAIPLASTVLQNHPGINEVIVFDKRGKDHGVAGILRLARRLRAGLFDLALVPHRSLRSAVLATLAAIPLRIGFSTSAGSFLFTHRVKYQESIHEIERNLSLLSPIGLGTTPRQLPSLQPSKEDVESVDRVLRGFPSSAMVAIAPGSVWNTKRWLKEGFVDLGSMLLSEGSSLVLIGGPDDRSLAAEIEEALSNGRVLNAAGLLTLLQSAELIRRCKVLVSNDSAPMHMAVAMRTPVVAIFGATVPAFGFAPLGRNDIVIETTGLSCRPCSKHGGEKCPIGTFVCMTHIGAADVLEAIHKVTSRVHTDA